MDYDGVAFRDKEEGRIIFLVGKEGRKGVYKSSGFSQEHLIGSPRDVYILSNITNLFEPSKYYLKNAQIENRIKEGIYVPLSNRELCSIAKLTQDSNLFNKEMDLNHYEKWKSFPETQEEKKVS